jgi:CMP-N-acetylneuraminic acid synthetase
MNEIIGLITARGGSKGIPRKNIQPVAGKPLIAWTIEAALRSTKLSRVIVSTDDEEIAQVAMAYGAEVPFKRPEELSRDDSPHILSAIHAIEWLAKNDHAPEFVMLLQPTSPLRTVADIDHAAEIMFQKNTKAVVSVFEVNQHPEKMYRMVDDGLVAYLASDSSYLIRQRLQTLYLTNGAIYLNRTESIFSEQNFVPPGSTPYIMPPERSLDVDSLWDMHLAELILQNPHVQRI